MERSPTAVSEFRADVASALPFGEEENYISATLFLPDDEPEAVLVCWPGGSYDRRYWCFDAIPGMTSRHTRRPAASPSSPPTTSALAAARSRPKSTRSTFATMTAAADEFVRQVRERFPDKRIVGVGHSLGGALTVATQALHASYHRIASLGMTHGAMGSLIEGVGEGADLRQAGIERARVFLCYPDRALGQALRLVRRGRIARASYDDP